MNTLINITENKGNAVVSARELHQFLESGKDFSNWIKDRINKYGFVEKEDFEVFANLGENLKGGRPSKEYAIGLDMAKELSMVERNGKGKEARRYFIAMEKIAKKPEVTIIALPPKRKHNRLTQTRLNEIMRDVCKIEDSELRLSISNKLHQNK